ncbi:MAG: DegT/DnrJ/EryC1/StrS family aminotransferase [Planctomycetota bacterium]|nr:DegT/DnrJ/EryC1/StrS family aminotransferase [Planctomycetota bacterium]MDA1177794.1 DegT/DnrJ/EryC1/StrS family aminotransferase [Planctomycetota bacterium]
MTSPTTAISSVPMLDLGRENGPLHAEIQAALAEVVASGNFILGPLCQQLEQAIAKRCGTTHAIGCGSGSDALLLALMAVGIGPGDEVILPSFTFFATASAVSRLGARPVFAEIEPGTFNLDPQSVVSKITRATRAILPVHLFGQCASMDSLRSLAVAHDLVVIEDAAQAIDARYHNQFAGSMGSISCFSFYPTKNLGGCGDGGMLTTSDDRLADRLELLRAHGMRPRYEHHLVGINSRLDAFQSAILLVKLRYLADWTETRRVHAQRYFDALNAAGIDDVIQLPAVDPRAEHVWNQFTIRVLHGQRDRMRVELREQAGVGTEVYYPIPLHLQPCFTSLGYRVGSLPLTERASQEVLSLPIHHGLTMAEQQHVIDAVVHHAQLARFRMRRSAKAA